MSYVKSIPQTIKSPKVDTSRHCPKPDSGSKNKPVDPHGNAKPHCPSSAYRNEGKMPITVRPDIGPKPSGTGKRK